MPSQIQNCRLFFYAVSTFLCVIGVMGSAAAKSGTLREKKMCTLPENAIEGSLRIDFKNPQHWFCSTKAENGMQLVGHTGNSSKVYGGITGIVISSTGSVGFYAITKDNKTVLLVVDGVEYPTQATSEGIIEWSPNGKRWIASWVDVDKASLSKVFMVDGRKVGRYKYGSWFDWSADSSHYVYIAGDDTAMNLILDGKKIKELGSNSEAFIGANMMGRVIFLNDKSLAAITPLSSDNWIVMKESKVLATFSTALLLIGNTQFTTQSLKDKPIIAPKSLSVSEDRSVIAWWARPGKEGSEWLCYVDGKKKGGCSDVKPNDDPIYLSPNGDRVAFRVRHYEEGSKSAIPVSASPCIDGRLGKKYDWLGGFQFSPDSKRCAYWAKRLGGTGYIYVVDGKEIGTESETIRGFSFSPDSKHFSYIAKHDEKIFLVSDGVENEIDYDAAWGLHYEDNNGAVGRGFIGQKGKDIFSVEVSE